MVLVGGTRLTRGRIGIRLDSPEYRARITRLDRAAETITVSPAPPDPAALVGATVFITNLVRRATAGAAELSAEELWHGAKRVTRLVCRHEPKVVAFVGVGAYRTAFGDPTAAVGPQPGRICRSRIWLLPNPSGLNAHYQLPELAAAFRALGEAVSS